MSCLINSGYTLGCRDSVGGVEYIAIAAHSSSTVYTYGTSSLITGMSPTQSFYKFEQYTEQAIASQEGGFDNNTGTSFTTQTITITLEQMDAATREQFVALTQARVRIIVKTQTGKYFLFGLKNGGRASASTSGPGQAMSDLTGFTLTFELKEPLPVNEMDSTLALSMIV
jgi:hypothetical protein